MNEIEIIWKKIEDKKCRSKWEQGVKEYALELLEGLEGREITKANLLNGAENWHQFSYGGSSLIYDSDICDRLATPSFSKMKKGGELQPKQFETWLDLQARALNQASKMILNIKGAKNV